MHVRDVIADFIAEILTLRVVSSTGMWITFIQKQWPACNKHSGSWQSHKHHFNLDQHYYFHIHLPPFLLCGLSKLLHSELHWLDISQRVQYKLGVIVHQCLQNNAPQYLVDYCKRTSNVSSRQRLRSANRYQLIVPRHRRSMFGRRAFSIAGPMEWNSFPDSLQDPAWSTDSFRSALKTSQRYGTISALEALRDALYKYTTTTTTTSHFSPFSLPIPFPRPPYRLPLLPSRPFPSILFFSFQRRGALK